MTKQKPLTCTPFALNAGFGFGFGQWISMLVSNVVESGRDT
jgi:hypothetical protein